MSKVHDIEAILWYAYRQGLILPAIVSHLLNDGKAVDSKLRDLEGKQAIRQWNREIQSRYSYGLIDTAGCNRLGVQASKATQLTPTRLDQRIGLAWFCAMEAYHRQVLLASELRSCFGTSANNKHRHVLSNEFGCPVVLRVYHAGSTQRAARDHVTSFLSEHRRKDGIATELDNGRYGLAVLGSNKVRVAELREEFEQVGFSGQLRIVVGLGPTAETYSDALAESRVGATRMGAGNGACQTAVNAMPANELRSVSEVG
ncbi:hypothetical protein [Rubripirellula reticaptiva]|uniref:Uncharacterized protein n=1 Tax=Rubripirellula reticaptiva TaxID=2528013 RepID=A0A5C6EM32_9BACT|nr:hypothetical protein [Rubripirellula reticaptiva]TWU49450.1 hypothetical protein Poly59_40650 [Rubripirellula reticaptiva]